MVDDKVFDAAALTRKPAYASVLAIIIGTLADVSIAALLVGNILPRGVTPAPGTYDAIRNGRITVRLQGIDAPESCQSGGERACPRLERLEPGVRFRRRQHDGPQQGSPGERSEQKSHFSRK